MSLSLVLDVAVGLIVVYYLLGSIVSLITQLVNETLETRGRALEDRLLTLLGDKKLGELVSLPQMKALQPIRYKTLMSVVSSTTEAKKLEKIPVAMLVDGIFDIAELTKNGEAQAERLKEIVAQLPQSEIRDTLVTWMEQGIDNVKDLRLHAADYFSGVLEQAAAEFRSRARSIVIMLSIFITLLFGTDTLQLAQTIASAEVHAAAMAQAQAIVQSDGTETDLSSIVDRLGEYSIRVGWWQTQQLPAANASASAWIGFIVLKILGLGITAMAVSQGSSFWYDLLKKVVNPTKALEPKG